MIIRPRKEIRLYILACALVLPGGADAAAQNTGADTTERTLRAIRVAQNAVKLDGVLDEDEWRRAPAGSGFIQRDPLDGAPATERTEVRVLYSGTAVYVGVRAHDSDASRITSELSRRDRVPQSDEIAVFFDSYHDRRTAFEFAVTPSGSIRDVYYVDEYKSDASWDPVWTVRTSSDNEGWTAEFRIPLTQLRYRHGKRTWGLQVMRRIHRKAERSYWSPYSKTAIGLASRFGTLEGLDDLGRPLRLEIRPYSMTSARRREQRGIIYSPPRETSLSGGADIKYGLTSDFTLDVAVNPDFGQVEADPAVVNLTTFETFVPEKRPFFVEGSGLFNSFVPGGQVFYSRRIGRAPQAFASPPIGGTTAIPDITTILGAAKVTGKTAHGLGLGLMSVVTAEENAILRDSTAAIVGRRPVEPLTHYLIGRIERDFRKGSHTIGTTMSSVNRKLPDELKTLRSASYFALADGVHRWRRNVYVARWKVGGSVVRGSRSAITAIQRSPLRYYQRADADHIELDSSRTMLTGSVAAVEIAKEAGTWRFGTAAHRTSPGLDFNDIGFQWNADFQEVRGSAAYVRAKPQGPFRNYELWANGWRGWTTGGELFNTTLPFIFFGGTFRNNWTFAANPMNVFWQRRCLTCLRGGPALRGDASRVHYLNVTTDRRKPVALGITGFFRSAFSTPERSYSISPTLFLKASETLNGSIAVRYGGLRDPAQWVGARTALDTVRYIVAEVNQTTASLTARINWTMTPRLSLEIYGQPFVSANEYRTFKMVRAPEAERFADRFRVFTNDLACREDRRCSADLNGDGTADLSFTSPDFHFSQLRSTSVLRWEYRPGSVIFVAWQHGRSQSRSDPQFGGTRDLRELFSLHPDNTLLVKANYWLSF